MAKVIAIVGASSNRHKFGNKALRAFRDEGYTVLAINPNEAEVEGIKTYPSVLDVPHAIDMASVYVPPDVGQGLLAEFEKKQIAEIWLNPGAESDELLAEARKRKLNVIAACSIVGIGRSPYEF
jgi:predicted CoA-binding protein